MDTPDTDLMTRLAAGELAALGVLYDRYAHDVRRFLFRMTQDDAAVDDLTQDAFIALWRSADRYEHGRPVRSFIIGIANNLALRRRRRAAVSQRILHQLGKRMKRTQERTPEDQVAADQQIHRYKHALHRLSDAKRATVLMADVEGMSGPEIAEVMNIPVGTVWTRLHHARAELRTVLRAA